MKKGIAIILASLLTVAVIAAGLAIWLPTQATAREASQMEYKIKAGNATLNRKVMGEVVTEVNGVPASPVHSFVWDGDGVTPIKAKAQIKINPVTNSGEITAEWKDENGEWAFKQTAFSPPPHSTGLRVGPSASSTELVMDDPVTTNVYLHGNTTAGGPVLPTDFNLLATWGPAEVTLNGQPFNNPFDGPAPLWVAHTMTTVGVRNSADGTVRTTNGDIFNPMAAANGAVDNNDLEFHLVFHEAPGPNVAGNFPPPHAFFYHLTFEDVKIDIKHAE